MRVVVAPRRSVRGHARATTIRQASGHVRAAHGRAAAARGRLGRRHAARATAALSRVRPDRLHPAARWRWRWRWWEPTARWWRDPPPPDDTPTPTPYAAVSSSCVDTNGDGRKESARVHFEWDTQGLLLTVHLLSDIGGTVGTDVFTAQGAGSRDFTRVIGHKPTHIGAEIEVASQTRSVGETVSCQAAPPPPKAPVILKGHIEGPCERPMYRVTMSTKGSSEGRSFTWTFTRFSDHKRVVLKHEVPKGTVLAIALPARPGRQHDDSPRLTR